MLEAIIYFCVGSLALLILWPLLLPIAAIIGIIEGLRKD